MGKGSIPFEHEFFKNVTLLKVNQETDVSTYIIFKAFFFFFLQSTLEKHEHIYPTHIHAKK